MTMATRVLGSVSAVVLVSVAGLAAARKVRADMVDFDHRPRGQVFRHPFVMIQPPLGAPTAPAAADRPASLQGGTLAALAGGALLIDPDSGELVRTDATGAPV